MTDNTIEHFKEKNVYLHVKYGGTLKVCLEGALFARGVSLRC